MPSEKAKSGVGMASAFLCGFGDVASIRLTVRSKRAVSLGSSAMSESLEPEGYPVSFTGGPNDLLRLFPTEMSRLGVLSAFWVSTDHALCQLFEALLDDPGLAHAAFYSIVNARARREMVTSVVRSSTLSPQHMVYVECAIEAHKIAADKRNDILHSLLVVHPETGDLATSRFKPQAKTPVTIAGDVSERIRIALHHCYRASALLALTTYLIDLVHNRTASDIQEIQRIERLLDEAQTLESP